MTPSIAQSRPAMPVLEQVLLGLLFLGAVAVASLPAARDTGGSFGWMPLWLLALPLASLATAVALRRLRGLRAAPARAHRRRSAAAPVAAPHRAMAMPARRPRLPRAA